jgi:hypothetical protein
MNFGIFTIYCLIGGFFFFFKCVCSLFNYVLCIIYL